MHLRWLVLEKKGEGVVDWFGINYVVIVKDEDEILEEGSDLIYQGCQNRFGWWWLRGLEYAQHSCAKIRRNRLQSSDQIY